MESPYPTFKEFCQFNDWWRLKQEKETQPKLIKAIYYPFALLLLSVIFLALLIILGSVKSASAKSYRYSDKYKKVIKEGILFDTTEYHER